MKTRQVYTDKFEDVIWKEKEYLELHREKNKLKSLSESPDLIGLCFSGGGIRSATFNLGIIQGLIKAGIMKKFDYLSTVSGGGYIGSCLTSLLSGDKSKISGKELGLDPDNSPFVGLNQYDEYDSGEETKLGVRHQMHHLRTHGDFLISEKGIFRRTLNRAAGNVLSGIAHHFILFIMFLFVAATLSHLSMSLITGGHFFEKPRYQYVVDENLTDIENIVYFFPKWFDKEIIDPFNKMINGIESQPFGFLVVLFAGILWSLIFMFMSTSKSTDIAGKNYVCPPEGTKSGYNAEDHYESKFLFYFYLPLFIMPIITVLISYFYIRYNYTFGIFWVNSGNNYFTFFLLPFTFSAGALVISFIGTSLLQSFLPDQNRIHRSILDSLKGSSLIQTLAAFLSPLIILGLFSLNYISVIMPSVLSIVVSYFLFKKEKPGGGIFSKLKIPAVKKYLLNIFLVLFTGFTFSFVSGFVINKVYNVNNPILINSIIIFIISAIIFMFWGTVISSNKVSPHYFYRDRLIEAYLKTDARIKRNKNDWQGMPLKVLRNDESLKIKDLGEDNFSGPYHLIVTALNLQGSDELNRKTMLSEHFIFSKYYTGSKITGYVDTAFYRGGNTKLARAVTISGAAVASAMGYLSFWGQNFASTLFNARLGYWVTNPWFYRKEKFVNFSREIMISDKLVFWPKYLAKELMGKVDARSRLINLSDGGHTGDNLGLIPLLQRRCKTIVVCDAEADKEYFFGSFNNAVRMAFIEENIKIDINLSSIVPVENEQGQKLSSESVVIGKIYYPALIEGGDELVGSLIYIKSSISKPVGKDENIPVHIVNYNNKYFDYPHQSTADQFFDDSQFEAYRALGEYIVGQAMKKDEIKDLFV